jgi:diketogulonate reductase-like aldo/keto reductase
LTEHVMEEHAVVSKNGVIVPKLIYGTAWKKERTAALVARALELGFRGVDTACQPKHYNEAGVGEGVASAVRRGLRRDELYLQTKFTPISGQDPEDIPYDPKAGLAEQVRQSHRASLRNQGVDYLDCLVLHSPYADVASTLEVWQAMESLCAEGGVRQLGVSNIYDPGAVSALWDAARIKPAVIQNRFYAKTGYDHEIRGFCRDKGILYQSFWTLTANQDVLEDPRLLDCAQRHGRTAAQVFFRYLTQIGVICLIGAVSEHHLREDLKIFDFELEEGELEILGGALADRRKAR